MNKNKTINVNIWPANRFYTSEAIELSKNLRKISKNLNVERGKGARGRLIQVIIEFAFLNIAIGFLNELGKDLYKLVKSKFIKTIIKPLSKEKNQKYIQKYYPEITKRDKDLINILEAKKGSILLLTKYKGVDINLKGYYRYEKDIDEILKVSVKVFKMFKTKIDKNKTFRLSSCYIDCSIFNKGKSICYELKRESKIKAKDGYEDIVEIVIEQVTMNSDNLKIIKKIRYPSRQS